MLGTFLYLFIFEDVLKIEVFVQNITLRTVLNVVKKSYFNKIQSIG